eukprot:Em0015g792a
MYKTGKVEGQKVTDILLDTGCSRTMVRLNLVAMEKIIVGRVATITCAHGDTKLHPLALVEVELDGSHIQVEAALSEELPVSVLLGTDVPELTHLISGTGSSINLVSQEQVMVVMTRAKAKQQLEEELIRKEKELLSGAQSNTLVRVNEPVACDNVVPSRSESEAGQAEQQSPRKNSKLTKDQRREIRKKAQETEKSREGGNSEYPDITIEDLKKLQAEDPTLAEVLRAADRSANDRNESVAEYFRREGLVYRRWTPKGRSSTFQVEQLVLPKRCRVETYGCWDTEAKWVFSQLASRLTTRQNCLKSTATAAPCGRLSLTLTLMLQVRVASAMDLVPSVDRVPALKQTVCVRVIVAQHKMGDVRTRVVLPRCLPVICLHMLCTFIVGNQSICLQSFQFYKKLDDLKYAKAYLILGRVG